MSRTLGEAMMEASHNDRHLALVIHPGTGEFMLSATSYVDGRYSGVVTFTSADEPALIIWLDSLKGSR